VAGKSKFGAVLIRQNWPLWIDFGFHFWGLPMTNNYTADKASVRR
jgi:hypothetical protein